MRPAGAVPDDEGACTLLPLPVLFPPMIDLGGVIDCGMQQVWSRNAMVVKALPRESLSLVLDCRAIAKGRFSVRGRAYTFCAR